MRKTSPAVLFAVTSVVLMAGSSALTQAVAQSNPNTDTIDDPYDTGPRVASPSKLGSLLIWPTITINAQDTNDTIVEITNNHPNRGVNIECEYVNEQKARVDFSFFLSPNETASWDVLLHKGEQGLVTPPPFPEYPTAFTAWGLPTRGELVCFAVDSNTPSDQISWNYLTGTATPIKLDATIAAQPKMAYRYNAWAFATGRHVDHEEAPWGISIGQPGTLILDGSRDHYDACPALNQANFQSNGSTLGNLTTIENDLRGVGCYQDLRQDFTPHFTKLLFTVWNALEQDFTGAFQCVDSVFTVPLTSTNTALINNTFFDWNTLGTANAHFQVSGIASDQCSGTTENVGLLTVVTAQVTPDPGGGAQGADEIGNPAYGEGIFGFPYGLYPSAPIDDPSGLPGFVLWDPVN